jgi:hypothetical protein
MDIAVEGKILKAPVNIEDFTNSQFQFSGNKE